MKSISIYTFLSFLLIFRIVESCQMNSSKKYQKMTDEELLSEGAAIAGKSFVELSSNLQSAVSKGGISNAMEYCKVKAVPLIDSLSQLNNVTIRRTSFKYRNEANKPFDYEEDALNKYSSEHTSKNELTPMIHTMDDGSKVFFSPILTNDFCLNCHGSKTGDIQLSDFEKIQELYPEDLATGYAAGDLRGMWSISFIKK